jgi:hypothetical protein
VRDRHALTADALDRRHHLDLAVAGADLVEVVELHAGEDEREAQIAAQRGDQRRAPLLQQLVVDRLVEVAEHVHVAPPQADPDPGLRAPAVAHRGESSS